MYRIIILVLGIVAVPLTEQKTAYVRLIPNNAEIRNVTGELTFIEGKNNTVQITGKVYGLTEGLHGFHVHEKGDLQDGCNTTGAHFNPNDVSHGAPSNDKDHRHIGDLGNIQANAQGEADVHIRDALIALSGENSILGRAIVVHSGEDDLGRAKDKGSLSTGNAGGRWACGIIKAD